MSGLLSIHADSLFAQYFLSGGPIVWFVLLPMSMVMLYVGADLGFRLRRSKLLPPGRATEIATLAGRHGISGLASRLNDSDDILSRVVVWSIGKTRKKGLDPDLLRQAASDCLREQGLMLSRRAEGCHLIGTVAPMVGLFGTVFGMIKAFTLLSTAGGQPRPDQLAGAISVALVTTFWGLLVAIPALFMHGFFRTRIETLISEAALETEVLLEHLADMRWQDRAPISLAENDTDASSDRINPQPVCEPESKPLPMESRANE